MSSLGVTVKVCGIRSAEIGNLALSLGANFLGCIVYPKSPRFVPFDEAKSLFSNFPQGKRVAVTVRPTVVEVEQLKKMPFDFFQFHFDPTTDIELVKSWSKTVGNDRLWLAPKIAPDQQFPKKLLQYANAFVLDSYKKDQFGGTGTTGSWDRFQEFSSVSEEKNWILAGGINPDNVKQAIEQTGTAFIDVNSGVESSPGVKEPELVKKLFLELNKRL